MRLEDFLYLQRDLESRPCREILYIRCTHIMRVVLYVNPLEKSPPPLYTPKTIVLLLFTSSIFKDTLYFYLSTFCFQYFLHLFKSFSLLITSTTRVQIQNHSTILKTSFKTVCFRFWISIITSKIIFSIKIFNFYKFFSKTLERTAH